MRVVDRLGLTATGVESFTLTGIRAWLDRVRAGGLTETEHRATLVLTFRLWIIAFFLKMLGSGWDVSWHFRWFRDDFAPPHNINLVGDGMVIVLVLCHWYTKFAVDRLALRLMISGITLFVVSAPVDVINHRINGLDITAWSLTHFGLYTGTGIMIAAVIRAWRLHGTGVSSRDFILGALWFFLLENVWFAAQQQEYGVLAIRNFVAGHPTADAELLEFARNQAQVKTLDVEIFTSFALPIPDWVYPVWAVGAAMFVLLAARRSIGRRFTATTVGFAYVTWRCVMWPILVGFGFPPSTVPFLLMLGAVAIDVICLAGMPWLIESAVGAVVVTTMVYLGVWAQAALLAAPPISYWSAPVSAVLLLAGWLLISGLHAKHHDAHF
jgi:hypothetical protein